MTKVLQPQNDRVLIKPIEVGEEMYGNIIVPDMGKEKPEMGERIEMKRFIEYLTKSEFIEHISEEGLWFIQIEGRKIPRNEISAYVKITSKGFDIIRESDKNKKNSYSFYLNIILGLTSMFFVILNFINKADLETTQTELKTANDSLSIVKKENLILRKRNVLLEYQFKEKKTDLPTRVKSNR